MGSVNRMDRENREKPVPLDDLLESCPKCGATVGERCTKKFGGRIIATAESHQLRVELVRRIRRLSLR